MKTLQIATALFLITLFMNPAAGQTILQQPKVKKIIVTGSAEMEIEPNEIHVNFMLREYTNSRKEKTGIEAIRKEFLEACEKSGIPKENIRVEGMAGNAYNNWFIRKRKKDPEFIANITYTIKFASTKMIDDLVPRLNDDAVQHMYISKMDHTSMDTFRKETKIKATKAAKEKAVYLAESIGEKISGALLIEEIEQGPVYPMMKQANVMMEADASGPYGGDANVPFEKIKIRYETRAEFELQ